MIDSTTCFASVSPSEQAVFISSRTVKVGENDFNSFCSNFIARVAYFLCVSSVE